MLSAQVPFSVSGGMWNEYPPRTPTPPPKKKERKNGAPCPFCKKTCLTQNIHKKEKKKTASAMMTSH